MFDENGHFFVVHGSLDPLNLDHCFVRHPRCCIDEEGHAESIPTPQSVRDKIGGGG